MESVTGIYRDILIPPPESETGPEISLQKAMLDASIDCIKLISPEGSLRYMNRAGCEALGVSEDGGFGMPWLPLLPAIVHKAGNEALNAARQGRSARFAGQSELNGKMQYWDNLLTPVAGADGTVHSMLCVSRDVTAKTLLERSLAESAERERLLTQEMRHRIKNVFSIVSALISYSEREAADTGDKTPLDILRGKLQALARASDATFADAPEEERFPSGADVHGVVTSVLEPYRGRFEVSGEATTVGSGTMTAISLLLHELATNSVKYGALGSNAGRVGLEWEEAENGVLRLTWRESGGPPLSGPPQDSGFGMKLIGRVVQSLGGSMAFSWLAAGLTVTVTLPLAR